MAQQVRSIPRPLVQTNQWFIVICVAIAWVSGQTWFLALPLIAGLLGLVVKFNPVIWLAKRFLTKHPSAYAQEDANQQQFNQIIAVACLALGWAGFLMGSRTIGYIFSAAVFLAAFIAILGFCVGCFIRYQYLQFRHRRTNAAREDD